MRYDATDTSKLILQLKIVIDRIHFKGQMDEWCKRNCDPDSFPDLEHVSAVPITIYRGIPEYLLDAG